MSESKIPTAWSYSSFDMWRTCPLKYKLTKIDKLDKDTSPAMIRGNAVHIALAHFIEGKPVPLPKEVSAPYHQALYQAMRDFDGMKVVEHKLGLTEGWSMTGYFGKDIWLRAVLDVGLVYDDGDVEVIDHKTGKRYGSNDDQVELFAAVAMSQFKSAKDIITRLIYVDSGEEEIAHFPGADRDKLQTKWAAAVKPMLADRTFLARPNDKCRFCVFGASKKGYCRHG